MTELYPLVSILLVKWIHDLPGMKAFLNTLIPRTWTNYWQQQHTQHPSRLMWVVFSPHVGHHICMVSSSSSSPPFRLRNPNNRANMIILLHSWIWFRFNYTANI